MLDLLEPHWAPNNGMLWRGYRSEEIAFPFVRVHAPPFTIEVDWTVERIVAFVRTWSAWKRAMEEGSRAESIPCLERHALEQFAGAGTMRLSFPIPVAAGREPQPAAPRRSSLRRSTS